MKYELGKILRFNNSEFGFLEYNAKLNKLKVYSTEEKDAVSYTVPKNRFDAMYLKSEGTCKETVEYAKKRETELAEFKKTLKPGFEFIGTDNYKYTFMKLNRGKIEFYSKENTYIAPLTFIKSLTGAIDLDYINHLEAVTTKKEYESLSLKDKITIALNEFKLCHGLYELEDIELGNIVSGEAYYHEVDDYYPLIGLQIKFKDDVFGEMVGFYPIFRGRIKAYYPTYFPESYLQNDFDGYHYSNGCGDELEVHKILIPKNEVDKVYNSMK